VVLKTEKPKHKGARVHSVYGWRPNPPTRAASQSKTLVARMEAAAPLDSMPRSKPRGFVYEFGGSED
jgi:hypothetical protein